MRLAVASAGLTAALLAFAPLGQASAEGHHGQDPLARASAVAQRGHAAHRRHAVRGPGRRRIARAVAAAERSQNLWATINVCDSARDPNALGVRGQMPTLGFRASLSMVINVRYWSRSKRAFVPIQTSTATATESLGHPTRGLQQSGAIFPFRAHAGLLDATVTFIWARGGSVIGQTERRTTAGHPSADYGSPPRYSAARCTIR